MADFVDSTVKDIDSRLRELKVEVTKLEAARADDREILERGWRRDVRGLEAKLLALRQECDDAGKRLDAILTDD